MRHVQLKFVLVHFNARSATEASANIAQLAKIAIAHGAAMEQLLGTLVLLHHGALPSPTAFDRGGVSTEILARLPEARIVHGRAPGSCGNFGSERQMFFGVTFLGSQFALARVLELPPGTVEELGW